MISAMTILYSKLRLSEIKPDFLLKFSISVSKAGEKNRTFASSIKLDETGAVQRLGRQVFAEKVSTCSWVKVLLSLSITIKCLTHVIYFITFLCV